MPRVRSVYVPRFGSQLSSSKRSEHGPDQFVSSTPSETDKRGKNRREKAERPLLKVKLPKLKSSSLSPKVIKDVRTPTKWTLKPSSSKTKLNINQEKQTECTNTASALVDGDVFFFTQRSNTQPQNEKEKAKLSVLRTISKMLEENQLIRRRLSALSQAI